MPIVTSRTEAIGSSRKADRMVERGREGTEVNRFNSSEPNRFTYVIKPSFRFKTLTILFLPLSTQFFSERSSQMRVFFSGQLLFSDAVVLSPNGRRRRVFFFFTFFFKNLKVDPDTSFAPEFESEVIFFKNKAEHSRSKFLNSDSNSQTFQEHFETNISHAYMKRQLDKEEKVSWLPLFNRRLEC
jgi:hypothetical protein